MEFFPENGLAGTRKQVRKRGQINVRASNHDNVGLPVHNFLILTAGRNKLVCGRDILYTNLDPLRRVCAGSLYSKDDKA
jgi:hypothetical protein